LSSSHPGFVRSSQIVQKFLQNSEPLVLRPSYIQPQPARGGMEASGGRLNWAPSRSSSTTGKQRQRVLGWKRRQRPDGASRRRSPGPGWARGQL
jgi:hypothetical protein